MVVTVDVNADSHLCRGWLAEFDFPLTDNAKLKTTLSEYSIPRTTFKTIEVNGVCESDLG